MKVNRGKNSSTTAGERTVIYCEGREESADILFYTTILGANKTKFELKPFGSSNTLLYFAREDHLMKDGFCLIDRDFRTDEEVHELETIYKIKFLPVHEIENLFLNSKYLKKLDYCKTGIDVDEEISKILELKKVRYLADFLQFKINTHLDQFPRISKLKNNELSSEEALLPTLLSKLDINHKEVTHKIQQIEKEYLNKWKNEFESLTIKKLPGKEIFKELKKSIFIQTPKESDVVKDIALLMNEDSFIPPELQDIFQ